MSDQIPALRALNARYLDQYFGVWCVEPQRFAAAVERVRKIDLQLHVREQNHQREVAAAGSGSNAAGAAPPRSYPYALTSSGTAIVDISGTLMKQESSVDASMSSVLLRGTMRKLRADESVQRVILRIDSPGGTAAGTQDLADDIAALAAQKPCAAYIEDLGCSAAYWIASQCPRISTNRTGIVGSIGTFVVIEESYREAQNDGIEVHVLSTGPLKGAGVPGTKITKEQLAEWQQVVDALNAQFLAGVSRGRKMSADKVAKLADGGVHVGADAKNVGLVDAVESFDDALAALEAMNIAPSGPAQPPTLPRKRSANSALSTRHSALETDSGGCSAGDDNDTAQTPAPPAGSEAENKETEMSQPQQGAAAPAAAPQSAPEPKPASIKELRAAFPSDPAFALESAEKALTLVEAKAAYADVLQTRLSEANQKLAQAATKPAEQPAAAAPAAPVVPAKKPGVPALDNGAVEAPRNSDSVATGDAEQQFKAKVQEQIKAGKSRDTAVALVAQENPELHQAMIEQATANHNKRRALLRQLGQR
jgi:signal peptide peptidase SppA